MTPAGPEAQHTFGDREAQARVRRLLRDPWWRPQQVDWNDSDQATRAVFKIAAFKLLFWGAVVLIFVGAMGR
jgi:hypothetical protein